MIYIIGGEGFIGSAVVRFCQKSMFEYRVISRQNYNNYIGSSCDILINSNGNSKKYLGKEDPVLDFKLSVLSVRESLKDFNFNKYLLFSSCDVYPDCSNSDLTDEDTAIDISKQSTYGFHKYLAEECVRHCAKDWMIIRFGGFVGPNLKKNPIYDILTGGPLWLDPGSQLQYLHTDEAAKIIFYLVDIGIKNEIINVCGNGLVKLSDVITLLGRDVPVKPGSPFVRYDVNINKLKKYCIVPNSQETVIKFIQEAVTGLNRGEAIV